MIEAQFECAKANLISIDLIPRAMKPNLSHTAQCIDGDRRIYDRRRIPPAASRGDCAFGPIISDSRLKTALVSLGKNEFARGNCALSFSSPPPSRPQSSSLTTVNDPVEIAFPENSDAVARFFVRRTFPDDLPPGVLMTRDRASEVAGHLPLPTTSLP